MPRKKIVVWCWLDNVELSKPDVIKAIENTISNKNIAFNFSKMKDTILNENCNLNKSMKLILKKFKLMNYQTYKRITLKDLTKGTRKVFVRCNWDICSSDVYMLLEYGKYAFRRAGQRKIHWKLCRYFYKNKDELKRLKKYLKYAILINNQTDEVISKEEIKIAIRKIKYKNKFKKM